MEQLKSQSAVGSVRLLCDELQKRADAARENMWECKRAGDIEMKCDFRGQRDAYLDAIELIKSHNTDMPNPLTPAAPGDWANGLVQQCLTH